MWFTYDVRSGKLYRGDEFLGTGYTGAARYRDNPLFEAFSGQGPLPRGHYQISPPRYSKRVGPLAMDLTPVGHNAYGRTALMIHGDNGRGTASRGCLILDRSLREKIAEAVNTQTAPVFLDVT